MSRQVLFDFAGTLAELVPKRERIVAEFLLARAGMRLAPERIAQAYRYLDVLMPYSSVGITSASAREEFYRNYNRQLFLLLGAEHAASSADLYAFFRQARPGWESKPGAHLALERLRGAGVTLALLSNFDAGLEEVLERLGLRTMFSVVLVSGSAGVEKPDPAFFRRALRSLGCAAADCVYVGDSYSLDYLPAVELGMRAFLLDEEALYPHLAQRIDSITDIEGIVLGGQR